MEKQATIFCVKTDNDVIHYIGKTISEVNIKGNINNSHVTRQYTNPVIRQVFANNEVSVVPLLTVEHKKWYDEKLKEIVEKYGENQPLLNAQWMLDGKRGFWEGTGGYWEGKTKDAHTIKRLTESKYKELLQYDTEGNLVKIWGSIKEIAIVVFKDYKLVNGSACSSLYSLLKNSNPKFRFKYGSYWFKRNEFEDIPDKLDIKKMCGEYKRKVVSNPNKKYSKQYTIKYYINGKLKKTFKNAWDAAEYFKLHPDVVRRICKRTRIYNPKYDLRYGEKKRQRLRIVTK